MILCDVAREDASVIVSDLRELDVDREGSIAIEDIDSQISEAADAGRARPPRACPGDAVVWEEVESRTSENIELVGELPRLHGARLLIAAVGIFLDSPILIIGAMVVGPEFGPIAGLCVALVQRRRDVARRSLMALAVGFPVGITAAFLFTLLIRAVDLTPDGFIATRAPVHRLHLQPRRLLVHRRLPRRRRRGAVADLGQVGRAGRGAGLGDDDPRRREHRRRRRARRVGESGAARCCSWRSTCPRSCSPGSATLYVQRRLYMRRRRAHLHDAAREAAGLPIGHSRRESAAPSYASPATGARMSRTATDLGAARARVRRRHRDRGAAGAANTGTAFTFGELAFSAR